MGCTIALQTPDTWPTPPPQPAQTIKIETTYKVDDGGFSQDVKYEDEKITFYYYPGFSGRMEPMLLLCADAGFEYDYVRIPFGETQDGITGPYDSHAYPKMVVKNGGGENIYAQTPAIMKYLGKKLGYDGRNLAEELAFHQVALNACDIWVELYTAKTGSAAVGHNNPDGGKTFLEKRTPTWQKTLTRNLGENDYFGGNKPCYADFSVLNIHEATVYMYGEDGAKKLFGTDTLQAWVKRLKSRPGVSKYFKTAEPVLYPPVKHGYVAEEAEEEVAAEEKITFYYYPGFSGRMEPLQMLCADAGFKYDYVRIPFGESQEPTGRFDSHAYPKMLVSNESGDHVHSQTTTMLQYLGDKLGYSGDNKMEAMGINQVALNAADIWVELYGAKVGSQAIGYKGDGGATFLENRASTWQTCLTRNLGDNDYFGGAKVSYADFALLNVYEAMLFCHGEVGANAIFGSDSLRNWVQRMKDRPAMVEFYKVKEVLLYPSAKHDYVPPADDQIQE